MKRDPNKADISRDIRVADAPAKHPEQVAFEEDLAYLKEISIPLEKRKTQPRPKTELERREAVAGNFVMFLVWIVMLAGAMFGVFKVYQSTLAHKADVQVQQVDAIYRLCERQNESINERSEFVKQAILARTRELKHTSGPRRQQVLRTLAEYNSYLNQIHLRDCHVYPSDDDASGDVDSGTE